MMNRLLTSLLFVGLGCSPGSTAADGAGELALGPEPTTPGQPGPSPTAFADPQSPDGEDAFSPDSETARRAPPGSLLRRSPRPSVDFGGTLDVTLSPTSAHLGPGLRVRTVAVPSNPGLYNIQISNTGSGWQELFLLQVPMVPPVAPAPALVVFHRYGVSHGDAYFNTTFPDETRNRGWYMVAPLGATAVSFSSLESQINTRVVLDYVMSTCNVDRNRIYGVGFSMGGGAVTNYAARHVDPAGVMFAAIANHTGSVSLSHVHANEYDDDDSDDGSPPTWSNMEVPDILETWHGGPPLTHAFGYDRCSIVSIDPLTGAIGSGTDMSRNLAHVPVLDWVASYDPLAYLRDQTLICSAHIQGLNPFNMLFTVPASVHSWTTLDESQVCNWLSQFALQLPATGRTLADQDGVYFHFQVQQDVAGAFTPFSWTIDPVLNRLSLWQTANLEQIAVDLTAGGLTFSGQLKVNLATSDGIGDRVLLLNVPYAPVSVTRDGSPASGIYDPVAGSYLIEETSGTGHQWVLTF